MKILAIDIGGTSVKMGLTDESGTIRQFNEYDSNSKAGGERLIASIIGHIHGAYTDFDCIGISTAGQVDSHLGKIIYANDNIPGYTGMNLREIFTKEFNVAVSVENDVNAAALGEKRFGAGAGLTDFLCLTYGTGIGGAIVIDDQLYKGVRGNAAEFGHIITHPKGKACTCGQFGCYEMYGSTTALVKNASELNIAYNNGREIFKAIETGDMIVKEIIDAWIEEIAYGLTSLIHIFNPPAIIIGGGIMEQGSLIRKINDKVKAMVMPSFADVVITQAELGNKAGLLGAATLHLAEKEGSK